jgi:hypothetical protein
MTRNEKPRRLQYAYRLLYEARATRINHSLTFCLWPAEKMVLIFTGAWRSL